MAARRPRKNRGEDGWTRLAGIAKQFRENGKATVRSVNEARDALYAYGRPALAEVRQDRPATATVFRHFSTISMPASRRWPDESGASPTSVESEDRNPGEPGTFRWRCHAPGLSMSVLAVPTGPEEMSEVPSRAIRRPDHARGAGNPGRVEGGHVAEDVGGGRRSGSAGRAPRRCLRRGGGPGPGGAEPRASRPTRWPGSVPRWRRPSSPTTAGQSRAAIRPADALIRPSSTTRTRCLAAPMARPARPRISKPPRRASESHRSPNAGAWRAEGDRDGGELRASPASSTPVPRPTTVSAGRRVRAASRAAAVVELPIPISPRATTRNRPAIRQRRPGRARRGRPGTPRRGTWRGRRGSSRSRRSDRRADERRGGRAQPGARRRPGRRRGRRPRRGAARTLIAAPPERKLRPSGPVTSLGVGADAGRRRRHDRPRRRRSRAGWPTGRSVRWIAASWRPIASNRPRLPGGMVSRACRSAARAAQSASGALDRGDRAEEDRSGDRRSTSDGDRLAELAAHGDELADVHQRWVPRSQASPDVGATSAEHLGASASSSASVELVEDASSRRAARPRRPGTGPW